MTEQVLFSLPLDRLEPIFKGWVKEVLLSTNTDNPIEPVEDEFLTTGKAAEFLSVSVPTVYGYIHQRSIPHMKKRGRLYFSKKELEAWVKSSRRLTHDEIRLAAAQSIER